MEGGIEWEETQQWNSRGIWERWKIRAFVGSMRTLWLRVERASEVVRALSLGMEYVRKFLRKESLGSRHTVRPQWMWGRDVVSRKAEEGRALSANSEWSSVALVTRRMSRWSDRLTRIMYQVPKAGSHVFGSISCWCCYLLLQSDCTKPDSCHLQQGSSPKGRAWLATFLYPKESSDERYWSQKLPGSEAKT